MGARLVQGASTSSSLLPDGIPTAPSAMPDARLTTKRLTILWSSGLPKGPPRTGCRQSITDLTGPVATSLMLTREPPNSRATGSNHIVSASVVRRNYRKYGNSSAVTDFKEFPGRTHWIIAQQGWQEGAGSALDWIRAHAPQVAESL